MADWEAAAIRACSAYRPHPDYEDLLAVARLAAWKHPDCPYRAAWTATQDYLRSPMNRTRHFIRCGGRELPEPVAWHSEEIAQAADDHDPARIVIAAEWLEWLIHHPVLTPDEREVLQLAVVEGEALYTISSRAGHSKGWAWHVYDKARRKLRRVQEVG